MWSILKTSFLIHVSLFTGCGPSTEDYQLENVFGIDQRTELEITDDLRKPLARLAGGCNAVMIGENLALTAAHCVYDAGNDRLYGDVKYIDVGFFKGEAISRSWISTVWIGTKEPTKNRSSDWAILQTAEKIGSQTGWYGIQNAHLGRNIPATVNLAGYFSDLNAGDIPAIHRECFIHKKDNSRRLLHDCDMAIASSGSPIFVLTENGPEIVALNVAEFTDEGISLRKKSYSHEYANIALDVMNAIGTIGQLKTTVEIGKPAPEPSAGVTMLINTNSSMTPTNQIEKEGEK